MRKSDLLTFVVLLAMLGVVMAGINAAEWMPGLGVVIWAGVIGLAAGTLLAASHFPGFAAHITSAIYGLFTITLIAGTRPDVAKAGAGFAGWRERVFVMFDRVAEFIQIARDNGSSRETLIFILILSLLFWLLGYTAAWYSFRTRRIWHVILPAGVTLFSNAYYYTGNHNMGIYLVLYLMGALVLLVQSHFADKEESWQRERIRFAPALRGSFIAAGLGITLVALLVSWRVTVTASAPNTVANLRKLNPQYNEFMARFNRMFSTLNSFAAREIDQYGNDHPLEGARNLTDDPVMEVQAPTLGHYYWRAQTLDFYDGAVWRNTATNQTSLLINATPAQQPVYLDRIEIQANFTLYRGTDRVRTASQPIRASLPVRGLVSPLSSTDVELQELVLPIALLPGNRYTAVGSMSVANIEKLRAARQEFPPAVTTKYLQLPDNVPQRVKDMAQVVASRANAQTNFDKAFAVELFLREYIQYDEKLEAPPTGVEASDYVLNTTRRAYCDYYATAMIVMLRSLGVPARMAVGYAQGTPEAQDKIGDTDITQYNVKANDAHAWVEVFFPEYGWVEFEPTANQPAIRRVDPAQNPADEENGAALAKPPTPTPQPQSAQPQNGQAVPTPTPTPNPASSQNASPPSQGLTNLLSALAWLRYLLVLPLLMGLAYGILLVLERTGLTQLPPVEQAYALLTRWAGWFGVGRNHQLTPFEQADALAKRAPTAADAAQDITARYMAKRFAAQEAQTPDPSTELKALWQNTRKALGKDWLKRILPKRQRKP